MGKFCSLVIINRKPMSGEKDKKTVKCMGCQSDLDTDHTGVKCPNDHHICSECSVNYVSYIFESSAFPPKCQL